MKPKSFDDLYKEAESHDDYWVAGTVQEFTEEICRLMESGRVTRSELARRLGTSPAYVTKILRGNANFTLATMVRLARALGAEVSIELHRTGKSKEGVEIKRSPLRRSRAARASADVPASAAASALR